MMMKKNTYHYNFDLEELRLLYRALTCLYNTSSGYVDNGKEIVKLKRKIRKIIDETEK